MPYIREECVAGKSVEVCKYFSCRKLGISESRDKRSSETPYTQEKINLRLAAKNLRRLMNANFVKGDLLVTLDFRLSERPANSKAMQVIISKFLRKLKAKLKKTAVELKYIYVKEVGKRGARHVHMMLNKIDTSLLLECWTYGGVNIQPLYTDTYEQVAEYFLKYADRTVETEGKLEGKKWYSSHNLVKPKVTKKRISAKKMRTSVPEKKGYRIDKDSICEGVTSLGYYYFTYSYIKDT